MRESFSTRSVPFHKVYLQSIIDVVEVDDSQKGAHQQIRTPVLRFFIFAFLTDI